MRDEIGVTFMTRKIIFLFGIAILSLWACDVLVQLPNTKVAVFSLFSTPEIVFPKISTQVHGKTFSTPEKTQEAKVVGSIYFGQRPKSTSTAAPTPLIGSLAKIGFKDRVVTLLEDQDGSPGFYKIDNIKNPSSGIEYHSGESYTFAVIHEGEAYGGKINVPEPIVSSTGLGMSEDSKKIKEEITLTPALEDIESSSSSTVTVEGIQGVHGITEVLKVSWRATGDWVFLTVFRLPQKAGASPELIYDNTPKDMDFNGILDLLNGSLPTSAEIPGEKFAEKGVYAIILVTAKIGTVSQNLFPGSPVIAGTGSVPYLFLVD